MTNQIKSFGSDTFGAKTFDTVFNEATGASSTYTLTCSSASYVLTGISVTFDVKISASTANYTITASSAGTYKGYKLLAEQTTFSATAPDANVLKSSAVSCSSAEFLLIGNLANLDKLSITGTATGTSTATASMVLKLVISNAIATGTSTGTCSRIRSKATRAGGAGWDVDNAGLAPKKKKKHETKHDYGYIITYSFNGQTDVYAEKVASESVLVVGNGISENEIFVEASIRQAQPITEVVAVLKRVA
jgi:hypothetical protein